MCANIVEFWRITAILYVYGFVLRIANFEDAGVELVNKGVEQHFDLEPTISACLSQTNQSFVTRKRFVPVTII